jgi:trehalose/maltose transport system substrate-binding protein
MLAALRAARRNRLALFPRRAVVHFGDIVQSQMYRRCAYNPPLHWLCLAAWLTAGCGRTAEPPRPAVIDIAGFNLNSGEQLRQDALEEFTRDTGIRVRLIPTWGTSAEQFHRTLQLLERRSSTPDVYLIDTIWPGALAEHLLDLRPYLDAGGANHLPDLLALNTVDGRLVSLPFYVNVGVLYYRTDLLQKYGYDRPPRTWDELSTMAARIQRGERAAGDESFWGYVWQGQAYEGLTCNALEWQASFGGGRIVEPDGGISINNAGTLEALRTARRWIGRISPASVLVYTESDSLNTFRAGKAAFLRHWSGALSSRRSADAPIRGRVAMALLPAGPHGRAQAMGGFQFAVSRYSAHPNKAARLVLYLTGAPVQLRRALQREYLPTIPSLYRDPGLIQTLPHLKALLSTGLRAWIARPSAIAGAAYGDVSKAYYETVNKVLGGKLPAKEALVALENELKAILQAGARR